MSEHRGVRRPCRAPSAGRHALGLPPIGERDHSTIRRWLQAGAPAEPEPALTPLQQRELTNWESFLNGAWNKERLMSRYLYEHLFLGHLYFEGVAQRRAFRIVRSATPPGTPVAPIAARRPYDDPRVPRVYYRLVPEGETGIRARL